MEQNETRTLWISLGAAAFAVILLYGWAQGKRSDYARKFGQTKTVLVAAEDILEMDIIDESKVRLVEKPSDFVEPQALDSPSDAIGLMPLAPIKRGEQILNTKLVSPGTSTGLSIQVSPLKRAITIPIDAVRGVSKLIRPGDRIDLAAAADVGKGVTKTKKVSMVLQDIPVLAVGKHIVDNLPISFKGNDEEGLEIHNLRLENNYKTLTIEVKPDEALNIYHILASGNPMYALLRNPNDRLTQTYRAADLRSVLKLPRKQASTSKKAPASVGEGSRKVEDPLKAYTRKKSKAGNKSKSSKTPTGGKKRKRSGGDGFQGI